MNRERIDNIMHRYGLDFPSRGVDYKQIEAAIEAALSEREQEILDWLEQQPVGSGAYMVQRWKEEQ